jgi:hypothetical protein
LAVPSATIAVGALNCTVLSLSAMEIEVDIGAPSVAPVAPDRVTVNVRAVLGAPSSLIVTGMFFGPDSPSFQCSVPATPA